MANNKKPNEFPSASLPLTGTEEGYSQTDGINIKYTIENIKDYVLTFVSGDTSETLAETLALGNVTGAFDISIDNGQVLKATNGNSKLDLRFGENSNFLLYNWELTGETQLAYLNGDTDGHVLGFAESTVRATENSVRIQTANNASVEISQDGVAVRDESLFNSSPPIGAIVTVNNASSNRTKNSSTVEALFLNTQGTFLSGVTNSVIVGGLDNTAKTASTAYMNQASFQLPFNTFDTIVKASVATKDNTIVLPNTSGMIAVYNQVTTAIDMSTTDGEMIFGTGGGATGITITLDTPVKNKRNFIKKVDVGVGKVLVDGNGNNIDRVGSIDLNNQGDFIEVVASDTEWFIVATNI